MTDYNDGKWWGWSGGDIPVHPRSEVEGIYIDPKTNTMHELSPIRDPASEFDWDRSGDLVLVAFRVIKAHKEPRVVWLREYHVMEDSGARIIFENVPPNTPSASKFIEVTE